MTELDGDWPYRDVADGAGKPYRLGQFVADERNSAEIRSCQPGPSA